MTVGSLCAGIGGFDLGFERAGMTVTWQVEIDPFCRKVLARHWPDVKRYEDLTKLTGDELEPVDLVCAGFPCQPVSVAGARKGQADERWIWPHIARLLGSRIRPRWVALENTPGLLTADGGHAFGEVIGDLAELGFDCEWEVLSAQDVGAPHLRKRVWIVAYSKQPGEPPDGRVYRGDQGEPAGNARASVSAGTEVAHAENTQSGGTYVADTDGSGLEGRELLSERRSERTTRPTGLDERPRIFDGEIGGEWASQCGIRPLADGVPGRVAQLRALGNSIVPQIAEWIGRRIIEVER